MSRPNAVTVNSRISPPSPGAWIEQLIWTTARARERARAQAATGGGQSLRQWVDAHHFVADREPVDFALWRYLGSLYDAIPTVPTKNLDIVVMKAAQAGASTWAMLATLWLLVTRRCQLAYHLPTKDHAMVFSEERFINLARENPPSISSSARAGSRGGLAR
jgi:hypothetical protein